MSSSDPLFRQLLSHYWPSREERYTGRGVQGKRRTCVLPLLMSPFAGKWESGALVCPFVSALSEQVHPEKSQAWLGSALLTSSLPQAIALFICISLPPSFACEAFIRL